MTKNPNLAPEPKALPTDRPKNFLTVLGTPSHSGPRLTHATLGTAKARISKVLVVPVWRSMYESHIARGWEPPEFWTHKGAALYSRANEDADWELMYEIDPGPYLNSKEELPWNR